MRLLHRKWLILAIASVFVFLGTLHIDAQQAQMTYTVQPGENLFRIALRYGTTVEALAAANQITDPTHITVGEVLIIPGGADTTPTQPQAPAQTQNQTQNQAPAQPPAANAAPVYYTVQDGDT